MAAEHAPGVQVLFPEVPRDRPAETAPLLALGDAEATGVRRLAPLARGSVRVDSAVYRARAFAADSARVGPLAVRFVRGADTTLVQSPSALVRVQRLTPGPDAEPEPPPEPLAFPSATPALVAFGVLGALLAALVGWGLWRAYRRPRRQRPRPAALPYPEATARLDALAGSPPTPETAQVWFTELSDALRLYLRRRHGIATAERTTREIDRDLARALPPAARAALRGALRVADQVKFADLRPGPEASRDALARAREGLNAAERHARERDAAQAAQAAADARAAKPPGTPTRATAPEASGETAGPHR